MWRGKTQVPGWAALIQVFRHGWTAGCCPENWGFAVHRDRDGDDCCTCSFKRFGYCLDYCLLDQGGDVGHGESFGQESYSPCPGCLGLDFELLLPVPQQAFMSFNILH